MAIHWQQEAQKFCIHVEKTKCECSADCDSPAYRAWFPDWRFSIVMHSSTPHGAMQKAYETLAEVLEDMHEKGETRPEPQPDAMYKLLDETNFVPRRKYELEIRWREEE